MMRFVLALLAALALSAAAPAAAAEQVLHRGNNDEPDTLDPHLATGSWEDNIIGDLLVGLVADDAAGRPIPGAAESWTVSPDGTVYTFTLREHTWSDGTPVTAEDFVFSFRRLFLPATASQYASVQFVIKNAAAVNAGTAAPESLGVRAVDARTLEITLEHPAPYFPELLTHQTAYPVPKHVVEQHGAEWARPGRYVSNGAFVLEQWLPNDHVRAVKNPRFFDAANVKLDAVMYYPTADQAAALKRFRAGELDVNRGFPSGQLDWMRANMAAEMRVAPYVNTRFITFNTRQAPFDNPKVREALSLAIDRDAIAGRILRAGEQPAWALVPPGIASYASTPPQLSYKGTPLAERQARAKALLAEAGFTEAAPLAFVYNYINDTDSRRMAAALQDMWKQIGVAAELRVSDKKDHYNTVRVGDYAAAEGNWIADFNDPANFLFLALTSAIPMNGSFYSNPAYDGLVAQADQTADIAARAALLAQAETLMLADHPIVPLFHGVSRNLVHTYVQGWEDNLRDVHRSRFLSVARP